jgi:hypothetical protein
MISLRRSVCALLMALLLFAVTSLGAENGRVEVRPADNGRALVNPQMGWTFQFYSNALDNYGGKLAPADTLDDFPGLSCIYLRLPWAYIEPEEGRFAWSVVDAPAQRWIDKGLQVAFRFTACETGMAYATPKWVRDAGAKGNQWTFGKGGDPNGPSWEPDYGDPVFLAKLKKFLEAAAKRYDGNPNVAFIDVGSLGVWGEGHTDSSTRVKLPAEVVKRHLDLNASVFPHTLLAMGDDFCTLGAGYGPVDMTVAARARQLGMTLRDDSICVFPPPKSYLSAAMAGPFWPHVPVILETDHYAGCIVKKTWSNEMILKAIEAYHASYLSIHSWPREFLQAERSMIDLANRRLGYRLQLREASWPASVRRGEPIAFRTAWANAGVAPCYPAGCMAITLKDAAGGIVAVFVDEKFDLRSLEVGPIDKAPEKTQESSHRFAPNMPTGEFDVFVSVGLHDGTPRIALPLNDSDGHRRYRLGHVKVVE